MRLRISPECGLLAAICIIDMLLTLTVVQFRLATEQNPLMAACLHRGVGVFVITKLLSFIPFIMLAELHRKRNPMFVRTATRTAIVLYLCIYTTVLVHANLAL